MTNSQLVGDNFEQGLRSPYYVDGRMLTAQDLKTDQQATRTRLALLGRAAGAGVIDGLIISQAGTNTLVISPGSGINREGDVLRLAGSSAQLSVIPQSAPSASVAWDFQNCLAPQASGVVLPATGAYLLAVRPAARFEGSTPLQTAGGRGTMGTCASRWEVEGLQFFTIRLKDFPAPTGSQAPQSQNLLAHWCFGTEALRDLPRDPFSFSAAYSGLDQIAADDLNPCDLPLAVFYWDKKLIFVDNWSVRRRITHPDPTHGWGPLIGDKRLAEGEACFLQFQDHLSRIAMQGNVGQVEARTHFRYLPATGILPISSGSPGFNFPGFFNGLTVRAPVFIDGAKVQALLRQSFAYPPVDLTSGEMLWLYAVRENNPPFMSAPGPASESNPYIIFTSGHIPYIGNAQFDVSLFDRSHYSLEA